MLIKVKFLKNGVASGRDYTYRVPEGVEVDAGNEVILPGGKHGVVICVNVPGSEIETFRDKIKCIEGKAIEKKKEAR